ncbi:MAG: hypothetical protein NXI10_01390 [bacterium]|nr:hypothetical protein [bacterium]
MRLLLLFLLLNFGANAQTIGKQQDGVSYEILSSKMITKTSAVHCGYNDFGTAKMARFRVEKRKYTRITNGKVEKVWHEDAEIYVECLPNQ